jgi:hypothetical protein
LIESEKKDLLLALALDGEAQKEAAHDSGASSCLFGFKEVYQNYKEQQIPIRTAGNTIWSTSKRYSCAWNPETITIHFADMQPTTILLFN